MASSWLDQPAHIALDRNGIVENRHYVHAAIVNAEGQLLFSLGDPSRMTLLRSCAKPAQTLAILEAGNPRQYEQAEVALMCSSHSSEPFHVARVMKMLERAGFNEADLRCGSHESLDDRVNRIWARDDYHPTPATSNCSGKHAGMLMASKTLGLDVTDYHHSNHPLSVRVKTVTEELLDAGAPKTKVLWGVDGCNLPAPAAPLQVSAAMYAKFAGAKNTCSKEDATSVDERTSLMARIFTAMYEYPEMVGGTDRFCTVLMRACKGRLIAKLGADGTYCVAVRAGESMPYTGATEWQDGRSDTFGLAVKIEDGSTEALYTAVVEILVQLGILPGDGEPSTVGDDYSALRPFTKPSRHNTNGDVAGTSQCRFSLKQEWA
jgi:L-asparaginase II